MSTKASLQDVSIAKGDGPPVCPSPKRDSSPSAPATPVIEVHHPMRSPRRHRRQHREGKSLALKAGLTSTPRSASPLQEGECLVEPSTQDQDSFIYAFLEEAIKKDKKRHRHSRRHEDSRDRDRVRDREHDRDRDRDRDRRDRDYPEDRERDERARDRDAECDRDNDRDRDETACTGRDCRHHTRRRRERDRIPRDRDRSSKEPNLTRVVDQAFLLETFAKLCTTINEKAQSFPPVAAEVIRTQSHKSLQCEVVPQREPYDVDQRPVRLSRREGAPTEDPTLVGTRVPSKETIHDLQARSRTRSTVKASDEHRDKYGPPYDRHAYHKLDAVTSRARHMETERYDDYAIPSPTRSCMDHTYRRDVERREPRGYHERREPARDRRFEEDRRKLCEQKMSRSFDIHRDRYPEDDRYRRTSRSDSHKRRYESWREGRRSCDPRDVRDRRYEERREGDPRNYYAEDKDRDPRDRHYSQPPKDLRTKRNLDRSERNSVASRDDRDDFNRDRDRYSERERDSGLSVADGDTSIVSGKSNYLRLVKQEISEQREAMDKMMRLWKELMRCFKGISQNPPDKAMNDSAANMQETAAAQLRLWRECMRRYETVARDVGDTDARLMEEITKQRSEMAEMATMWQECLQRYRDISNDFKTLKEKVQMATESPVRQPAPAPPLGLTEGEGLPHTPYRLPPPAYPPQLPPMPGPSYPPGSPLRTRASMPPAWWWGADAAAPPRARRRSSPDERSRTSRSRERRHRHKERDDSRYKEKTSKPTVARSEHRHRKR